MKPPEQVRRELVQQWIQRAEDDWRLTHRLAADQEPYTEATAFHYEISLNSRLGRRKWSSHVFPRWL